MLSITLNKTLQAASGTLQLALHFSLPKGKFFSLYGKSGAGKTSLLRMLAGLMPPDSGKIHLGNRCWYDSERRVQLPPQRRSVGMVFQDYALFPHLSVEGNLRFALGKGDSEGIIAELIALMELGQLRNRKPAMLSGGQQQRVALARALVQKPRLLLLDEPLSALDRQMRLKLQGYLREVHHNYGLTTLMVSHDEAEISALSDQVMVMDGGKILRIDSPASIFGELRETATLYRGKIEHIAHKQGSYLLSVVSADTHFQLRVDKLNGLGIGDEIALTLK